MGKEQIGGQPQNYIENAFFVRNKCLPKVVITAGWRLDNSSRFKELAYIVGFMRPVLEETGRRKD